MNAPYSALSFSLATLRRAAFAAVLLGSTMLVVVGPAHATDAGEGASFRTSDTNNAGEGEIFRASDANNAGEGETFRV